MTFGGKIVRDVPIMIFQGPLLGYFKAGNGRPKRFITDRGLLRIIQIVGLILHPTSQQRSDFSHEKTYFFWATSAQTGPAGGNICFPKNVSEIRFNTSESTDEHIALHPKVHVTFCLFH